MSNTYDFRIGDLACTAVSDGSHDYDPAHLFEGVPEAEIRKAMRGMGITTDFITTPYTFLVVNTGDHLVLVDTGAGTGDFLPKAGRLPDSLEEAGVDQNEIDMVIITHCHPDHIGGLLGPDRRLQLSNARFYLRRQEWEFWFSEEAERKAPPAFVEMARSAMAPLEAQVTMVDADAEIIPGVALVDGSGHTPGQGVVTFRSRGEKLLYGADTILFPLHLEHPDWTADHYDLDPRLTDKTKRRIIDMAVSDGWLMMFQHFPPFPSLGRIEKKGDTCVWVPEVVVADQ